LIPKNVVGQIAENLRVRKKDTDETSTTETDTEANKQDDNIMKTFIAGGSSRFTGVFDQLLLIVLNILVIGTYVGKPTFEILGPSINMVQQMEHHGVPMQVHVSRAVYELIYGDQFVVKERGQIEVNNGTVVTYLVTGRTDPN
jgi:hypothetical protein